MFSLESWHNDDHLLDTIALIVKNHFETPVDPLDLFRLGLTDKVTLDWVEVTQPPTLGNVRQALMPIPDSEKVKLGAWSG
jgi:hypothetical protein